MAVNIGPRIGIDGEAEYRKQINAIIQDTKTLKSEYNALSAEFDKGKQSLSQNKEMHRILGEEIAAQKGRIDQLKDMVQQAADKFGEADPKTQKWKEALNNANGELATMERELEALPSNIKLVGDKLATIGEQIKKAGDKIESFGRSIAPLSAIATGILGGATKATVDFESAMTGVQKTNDELVDSNGNVIISYDDLAESIKKMSTETASSKTDIAGVMEAAGQLGVGTEYLEDFTKTMVMLGDSTNLSADEAASALAKFSNITGTSLSDSDKLGSVIVALGNNFATTEQDIVDMSTRLASAGTISGLSETEILGLSAAMSSVGINAEAGGTAMTQTFSAIEKAVSGIDNSSEEVEKADAKVRKAFSSWQDSVADAEKKQLAYDAAVQKNGESSVQAQKALINLETAERHTMEKANELSIAQENLEKVSSGTSDKLSMFASVAGMTADEFSEAWKTKPMEALQAFITGLGNLDGESESTIALLDSLELSGVRQSNMLQSLSLASEMMGNAVGTANEAWEKNTALQDEAEKKYGTTASQLSQAKEKLTNIALEIGERMLPYLDKVFKAIDEGVSAWDKLDESQKDAIFQGIAGLAVLSPAIVGIGKVVGAVHTIVTTMGTVFSGGIATIVMLIGGIALAVGSVIDMIKNGWSVISTILEAIGLAIAAVAAVVLGLEVAIAAAVAATVFVITQAIILIHDHWAEITAFIKSIIDSMAAWWKAFGQLLVSAWQTACNNVKNAWSNVTNTLTGFFNTLQSRFSSTVSNLQNTFSNFVGRATRWGRDLMDNFIDGINSMGDRLVDTVSDIADTIADYLGFSEPDKGPLSNFHTYAPDMMELFAKGIKDNESVIQRQIESSFDFSGSGVDAFAVQAIPYAYMPDTITNNSVSIGSTQIVINAAEGQSVQDIADAVDEIINQRYQRAQMAWA